MAASSIVNFALALMRAWSICEEIGVKLTTSNIYSLRHKAKWLVPRGAVTDPEQGQLTPPQL